MEAILAIDFPVIFHIWNILRSKRNLEFSLFHFSFLHVEHFNWKAIACYQSGDVKTVHLDLARELRESKIRGKNQVVSFDCCAVYMLNDRDENLPAFAGIPAMRPISL